MIDIDVVVVIADGVVCVEQCGVAIVVGCVRGGVGVVGGCVLECVWLILLSLLLMLLLL